MDLQRLWLFVGPAPGCSLASAGYGSCCVRSRGGAGTATSHFATDDGREVHMRNRVASSGFRPAQHQRVSVRYDRAHPVRFEVRELRGASLFLVVVLVVMGIVFLVLGTVLALVFGGFAGGGT